MKVMRGVLAMAVALFCFTNVACHSDKEQAQDDAKSFRGGPPPAGWPMNGPSRPGANPASTQSGR